MSMTGKQRCLAAMTGQACDRTPVTPIVMAWGARQIGRTYRDFYLDCDVLVEANLALARDFGVDQVSAISDPWRESSAYGMEFDYPPDGVGIPRGRLIGTKEDLSRLRPLDFDACERTRDRIEAVRKLSAAVGHTHSVLGWVEGPIAAYADLRGVEQTMLDLIDEPDMFDTGGRDHHRKRPPVRPQADRRRRGHHRRGRRSRQPGRPGTLPPMRPAVGKEAHRGHPPRRRTGQAAHLRQHQRHPGRRRRHRRRRDRPRLDGPHRRRPARPSGPTCASAGTSTPSAC